MEYLKKFDDFSGSLNEAYNYSDTSDANLVDMGHYILDDAGEDTDELSDDVLVKAAEEKLKEAKPFPLTGKIKEDAPKLIAYIKDEFKRAGIGLDDSKAMIYSPCFVNEIEIPVSGAEKAGLFFQTYLDYTGLASNGSNFIISGQFASEETGAFDTIITDLSEYRLYVKATEELKQFAETQGIEI